MSFSAIHSIYIQEYFDNLHVYNGMEFEPMMLLFGPLLYLYIPEIHTKTLSIKRIIKHMILFLTIFMIIVLARVLNKEIEIKNFDEFYWIIGFIQLGFYIYHIRRQVRLYKEHLYNEYSNTNDKHLGWVNYYIYIFLAIIIIMMIFHSIDIFHDINLNYNILFACLVSISIFFIGYKGITCREIDINAIGIIKKDSIITNYEDINRIKNYILSEKPYLDSELTLSDLATMLTMSRNALSGLINQQLGMNFASFINELRVEETKALLRDKNYNHQSVLMIGYESGFSSKSSFN